MPQHGAGSVQHKSNRYDHTMLFLIRSSPTTLVKLILLKWFEWTPLNTPKDFWNSTKSWCRGFKSMFKIQWINPIFIGPRSDHSLPMSPREAIPGEKWCFFEHCSNGGGGQPMFKNFVGNCRSFWRSFNNMKFAWKGTFEALMVKFGGGGN